MSCGSCALCRVVRSQLEGGQFLAVRPVLMKRQKSSFHTLPCGVDVILGINGYIWLSPPKDVPSTVSFLPSNFFLSPFSSCYPGQLSHVRVARATRKRLPLCGRRSRGCGTPSRYALTSSTHTPA
jgi:exosome complex RNA-binding protein Rrp4